MCLNKRGDNNFGSGTSATDLIIMSAMICFKDISPTVFLRRRGTRLEQLAQVTLVNVGPACRGTLSVEGPGGKIIATASVSLTAGETTVDVFVPELKAPAQLVFSVKTNEGEPVCRELTWLPPRRWVVHVVHLSHHDVGYTDLASRVIAEHDVWLDQALEMAEATRRYPDEARFRIVVEQAWSIDHYLRHASAARRARMLKLIRAGQVEVTALFGNMITELCGSETLARCVYPAFRLQRDFGIPIISAEHNDIPGFSWGLSQVLTEAGVRIFCPGLPLYYSWGGGNRPSFWDEERIFGYRGMPGLFWWEAPSGKRVLFWSNNQGCGGDCHGSLPGLPGRLRELAENGYPYAILRWPVSGGARDNSPYIGDYADTIRDWNRRWAYPHLVSSTNARFFTDLSRRIDFNTLRVWRGDVPGQDYPVGAISTAGPTAVNRHNHSGMVAAETLAILATIHAGHAYPQAPLRDAVEEILWHDEHTWGYHFPCGPAACASELEKAVHAHRAAALIHEVSTKAMARIADAMRLTTDGIHLVVFNPLAQERTGFAATPLRQIDNCGSEMIPVSAEKYPQKGGYLRGVILNTRWPVHPPPELLDGKFDLVDVTTGEPVPYQIVETDSILGPEVHAAQRLGLAAGGKRYGFFENPLGLKKTLVFRANAVPALGYRTYRLVPRADHPSFPSAVSITNEWIENRYYRIEMDTKTGAVCSLKDKQSGREWIDRDTPHALGPLIVRDQTGHETIACCEGVRVVLAGPLCAAMRAVYAAPGHPRLELTVMLRAEERQIAVSLGMLKDPTPLLETFMAFPFRLPAGRFLHDGPLCVIDPATDRLPGAFANRLSVQNWVRVSDGEASALWSSLDAPVVSLARLWPSRVSPAHSSVIPPDLDLPPQQENELRGGSIYSCLTSNNFGTNFSVSQSGHLLFRYVLGLREDEANATESAAFGSAAAMPLQTIFTERRGNVAGALPSAKGFLEIDHPAAQLLAFKRAEDGGGVIIRLWNVSAQAVSARLRLPGRPLFSVSICTLAEKNIGPRLAHGYNSIQVKLAPQQVLTLRLIIHKWRRSWQTTIHNRSKSYD